MCTPIVGTLSETLAKYYVNGGLGVSVKGLAAKWNTEEDVKDVVEQINNCENLKFLELEGNTLGVDAAKAIGKALESKPELEVALWKDLFTGRLKDEIPQAMKYLFAGVDLAGAQLVYLDVSDNAIGPLGMIGLAPFFNSPSSFSLKILQCNNNGLGPQGATELCKALLKCRELSLSQGGTMFSPKSFLCGRNRMQNRGAIAIAKFIKECTTLEEIQMPENSVYWEGQCALAEAFAANPKLRVLNLNDNTITGMGMTKLGEAIKNLVYLEDLNLGDCLLRGSGALYIVNAIKDHPNLRKLVLDGNEITKPAGIEIAQILRTCRPLRHLSIGTNPFGERGAEQITRILNECETVEIDEPEDTEDEEGEHSEVNQEPDSDVEEENDPEKELLNDHIVPEAEAYAGGDHQREIYYDEAAEDNDEHYEDYEDYENSEEEDAVTNAMRFLDVPSLENYHNIPGGLPDYVYDLEYLNNAPHEICIQGALGLIEHYGKGNSPVPQECQVIFSKLMNEAVNFANSETDEFASSLLVHLGLAVAPEVGEYFRYEICNELLESLTLWLINVVNDKDVHLTERVLSYLKDTFQNARRDIIVDNEKLSTLIDYVLWRREKNSKAALSGSS